jgi:hypothetical protein
MWQKTKGKSDYKETYTPYRERTRKQQQVAQRKIARVRKNIKEGKNHAGEQLIRKT